MPRAEEAGPGEAAGCRKEAWSPEPREKPRKQNTFSRGVLDKQQSCEDWGSHSGHSNEEQLPVWSFLEGYF